MGIKTKDGMGGGSSAGRGRSEKTAALKSYSKKARRRAANHRVREGREEGA